MYDNAGDAGRYLAGTVCTWDGRPVYVSDVRNGEARGSITARIHYLPYAMSPEFWVDIADPRFNATQFRLGYMNCGDGRARFVSRTPARIQSQGLCQGNTRFRGAPEGIAPSFGFKQAIREQGWVDMMTGVYPSMEGAQDRLANDARCASVGISRDFAVVRHPKFKKLFFLEYRGREIAFSDVPVSFTLPEEYRFLKEVCEPLGVTKVA